jgi:hypothetical protein
MKHSETCFFFNDKLKSPKDQIPNGRSDSKTALGAHQMMLQVVVFQKMTDSILRLEMMGPVMDAFIEKVTREDPRFDESGDGEAEAQEGEEKIKEDCEGQAPRGPRDDKIGPMGGHGLVMGEMKGGGESLPRFGFDPVKNETVEEIFDQGPGKKPDSEEHQYFAEGAWMEVE